MPRTDRLWAITCYYNPLGWRRRLENYRVFREKLTVPLVIVELSNTGEFQLRDGDADILVQRRGRDVLWQTERLFNVALQAVPPECERVAWIDCDMVFARGDWPEQACRLLDRFPAVQLFHRIYETPTASAPRDVDLRKAHAVSQSFASVASSSPSQDAVFNSPVNSATGRPPVSCGGAWAYRREVLQRHGFYDVGILGGGDRAMVCAAFGQFHYVVQTWNMNPRQHEHYHQWAVPFFESMDGRVGYLESDLIHLWHGDTRKREYRTRHAGLKPFNFDPYADIAVAESGCWQWNSPKPELHRYVRDYFERRCEDG